MVRAFVVRVSRMPFSVYAEPGPASSPPRRDEARMRWRSEALVGEAADQAGIRGDAVGPATASAGNRMGEVDEADVIAFPDGAIFAVTGRRDRHHAVIGALLLL